MGRRRFFSFIFVYSFFFISFSAQGVLGEAGARAEPVRLPGFKLIKEEEAIPQKAYVKSWEEKQGYRVSTYGITERQYREWFHGIPPSLPQPVGYYKAEWFKPGVGSLVYTIWVFPPSVKETDVSGPPDCREPETSETFNCEGKLDNTIFDCKNNICFTFFRTDAFQLVNGIARPTASDEESERFQAEIMRIRAKVLGLEPEEKTEEKEEEAKLPNPLRLEVKADFDPVTLTVAFSGKVKSEDENISGARVQVDLLSSLGEKISYQLISDNYGNISAIYDLKHKVALIGSFKTPFELKTAEGEWRLELFAQKEGYTPARWTKVLNPASNKPEIKIEQNPLTKQPYKGVCADGVSSLKIFIALPGAKSVKVSPPSSGKIKGVGAGGEIKLNNQGEGEIEYVPPEYLPNKVELTEELKVHQRKGSARVWAKKVPLIFSWTGAQGTQEQIPLEILLVRPPIIMVHGFLGDKTTWQLFSNYLRNEKYDTQIDEYYIADQSIEDQAVFLWQNIQLQKKDYAQAGIKLAKVNIVSHSMGGLISRYYVQKYEKYDDDVKKLIMVGTPNHGVGWIRKKIGNLRSAWLDSHRIASDQLFCFSKFIRELNQGEKFGKHINPKVEYGNIFGFPHDWVVDAWSAHLNGVEELRLRGVRHSVDLADFQGVALAEYLKVWQQIITWLNQKIPRPPLTDAQIKVIKGKGEVRFLSSPSSSGEKIPEYPQSLSPRQGISTGQDSWAVVNLLIDNQAWGAIYLTRETRLIIGYASPQLVEVQMLKGSARFVSKKESGGHFSVLLGANNQAKWYQLYPQAVVYGLGTDFVITAREITKIHCLEGSVRIELPEPEKAPLQILSANKSLELRERQLQPITFPQKGWWEKFEPGFQPESVSSVQRGITGGKKISQNLLQNGDFSKGLNAWKIGERGYSGIVHPYSYGTYPPDASAGFLELGVYGGYYYAVQTLNISHSRLIFQGKIRVKNWSSYQGAKSGVAMIFIVFSDQDNNKLASINYYLSPNNTYHSSSTSYWKKITSTQTTPTPWILVEDNLREVVDKHLEFDRSKISRVIVGVSIFGTHEDQTYTIADFDDFVLAPAQ